jgi:RNA-directed DNA polymerase
VLAERIAEDLAVSLRYVRLIARSASHRYKTYQIPKRSDPRAFRTISQPSRELKLFQRWIVTNIIARLPVHRAAHAYRSGASIVRNAAVHRRNDYLLKVDFHDFFPSLSGADVAWLLRHNISRLYGFVSTAEDIGLVRKLTCKADRLTIGAPSSPSLSNAIMFEFDSKWSTRCSELGVAFSRYADDLTFSTKDKGVLAPLLNELRHYLRSQRHPVLTPNDLKTVFTSRKRKRVVTGVVLTPQGRLSIGRKRLRYLKSLVFQSLEGTLLPEKAEYLQGALSFARSVDPSLVERLRAKFGKRYPPESVSRVLSV